MVKMTQEMLEQERRQRIARMVAMRPGILAEQMAAELAVDKRTIYRAVARLRAEGLRIAGSRGAGGGFFLDTSTVAAPKLPQQSSNLQRDIFANLFL